MGIRQEGEVNKLVSVMFKNKKELDPIRKEAERILGAEARRFPSRAGTKELPLPAALQPRLSGVTPENILTQVVEKAQDTTKIDPVQKVLLNKDQKCQENTPPIAFLNSS